MTHTRTIDRYDEDGSYVPLRLSDPGPKLQALLEAGTARVESDGTVTFIAPDGVPLSGGSLWTSEYSTAIEAYLTDYPTPDCW